MTERYEFTESLEELNQRALDAGHPRPPFVRWNYYPDPEATALEAKWWHRFIPKRWRPRTPRWTTAFPVERLSMEEIKQRFHRD